METTAQQSTEALEKSVESTLDKYRSSFDLVPVARRTEEEEVLSSKAFNSRLATFRTEKYFAKPLCLSPLNCAAFGWQNTDVDILECKSCGCAICVAYHPSLNKQSHDNLTQQYFEMLSTNHDGKCIFSEHSKRWFKIMNRLKKSRQQDCESTNRPTSNEVELYNVKLKERTPQKMHHSAATYVPPYFLSLSNEFLRFEDASNDGSVTFCNIEEGASKVLATLPKNQIYLDTSHAPDALNNYCEVVPNKPFSKNQTAHLLATFGWLIDTNKSCMQCKICMAESIIPQNIRKRTRDEVEFHLVNSHRVYCPYVSGFSFGTEQETEAGWRVIVKNLVKYSEKQKGGDGSLKLDDLWGK